MAGSVVLLLVIGLGLLISGIKRKSKPTIGVSLIPLLLVFCGLVSLIVERVRVEK